MRCAGWFVAGCVAGGLVVVGVVAVFDAVRRVDDAARELGLVAAGGVVLPPAAGLHPSSFRPGLRLVGENDQN